MSKIPELVAQIIPALPDQTIWQCRAPIAGIVAELSAMEYEFRDKPELQQIQQFRNTIETRLNSVVKPR